MDPVTAFFGGLTALEIYWVYDILAATPGDIATVAGFAVILAVAMETTKFLAGALLAPADLDPQKRTKLRNNSWALVMRLAFSACEYALLFVPGYEGSDGNWAADTTTIWQPPLAEQTISKEVKLFYQVQLAAWVAMPLMQFFKPAERDQVAMLAHHTATLFLVAASYQIGAHRIGLLILFVHDASDVPCDLLKVANNLSLTGPRNFFLVEGLFCTVFVTWAAMRLWVFPRYLVYSVAVEARMFLDGGAGADVEGGGGGGGGWSWVKSVEAQPVHLKHGPYWLHTLGCLVLLAVLHFYWFGLFCRIAYRLLRGEDSRSVAKQEYEDSQKARAAKAAKEAETAAAKVAVRPQEGTRTGVLAAVFRAIRRLVLRVVLVAATLVGAVVAFLVLGTVLTPPGLRLYNSWYGEQMDRAARIDAVAGLSLGGPGASSSSSSYVIPEAGAATFELGPEATPEQRAFLRYHGFLLFREALSGSEVQAVLGARSRIEASLVRRNVTSIFGVPLFKGACPPDQQRDDPLGCIHRIPFASIQSEEIKSLVRDKRWEPVKQLFTDKFFGGSDGSGDEGQDGKKKKKKTQKKKSALSVRIGDQEKDGVVLNSYVNLGGDGAAASSSSSSSSDGDADPRQEPPPPRPARWSRSQLGWHTDALRDIAYLRMPRPMLNFGLHLDTVDPAKGDAALCLIPGTHRQGWFSFAFRYVYFISTAPDPGEICIATKAGDVTIHDGRLWHRVKPSTRPSVRRSAYVPYLTSDQPFEPKGEASSMPFYHHFGKVLRWAKGGQ